MKELIFASFSQKHCTKAKKQNVVAVSLSFVAFAAKAVSNDV
jgi:hypothetical protein